MTKPLFAQNLSIKELLYTKYFPTEPTLSLEMHDIPGGIFYNVQMVVVLKVNVESDLEIRLGARTNTSDTSLRIPAVTQEVEISHNEDVEPKLCLVQFSFCLGESSTDKLETPSLFHFKVPEVSIGSEGNNSTHNPVINKRGTVTVAKKVKGTS